MPLWTIAKQHKPRIPLFAVLHPSWNRSLDLKQIDQLVNPVKADLCGAPEGNTALSRGVSSSPDSHLPAVTGCASAYTGGPFMNASLTVCPGVKSPPITHEDTESRAIDLVHSWFNTCFTCTTITNPQYHCTM